MLKRILLLPILVFILSACDKTKDPGVEIPKPIDKAIISTLWNTVSEKYQYKDADGNVLNEESIIYENPNKKSIKYQFTAEHKVTQIDKFTNRLKIGTYEIIRENKKDFVIITYGPEEIEKYEVTAYTNTTMTWHIVTTQGNKLQYTKDGKTLTAASRDGVLELHCPCRDPQ